MGYYLSCQHWLPDENNRLQPSYDIKIATSVDGINWNKLGKTAIKLEGKEAGATSATIIKHKKTKKNNTAYQVFTKFGPIAFLPISDSETSVVYSVKKKAKLNLNDIINLTKIYNPKYSIIKFEKIENFELTSSNLRSYNHKNILAFGDLLHKVHPLAGQGFNMSIRDIKELSKIIKNKIDLGLEVDNSICHEFEKKIKHKNFLFSSGIDFVYEFFNFENKINSNVLSKMVKFLGKNKTVNKFFTNIADNGFVI